MTVVRWPITGEGDATGSVCYGGKDHVDTMNDYEAGIYVYNNASPSLLTAFTVTPTGGISGNITNVRVFAGTLYNSISAYARGNTAIKVSGTFYYGTEATGSCDLYTDYAVSPATSAAWTWAELADVQIGFKLGSTNSSYNTRVYTYIDTYTYLEITYTPTEPSGGNANAGYFMVF